jgi:hypothetical protein
MKTYDTIIHLTFTVADDTDPDTALADIVGAVFRSGDDYAEESHAVSSVEVMDLIPITEDAR